MTLITFMDISPRLMRIYTQPKSPMKLFIEDFQKRKYWE